jgi:hypothetical protein
VAAGAAASDEGLALIHNLDECSHSIQRERRRPDPVRTRRGPRRDPSPRSDLMVISVVADALVFSALVVAVTGNVDGLAAVGNMVAKILAGLIRRGYRCLSSIQRSQFTVRNTRFKDVGCHPLNAESVPQQCMSNMCRGDSFAPQRIPSTTGDVPLTLDQG